MGLSSMPTPMDGVFTILLVNTAISMSIFKEILQSLLHIIGFQSHSSTHDDDSMTSPVKFLSPFTDDMRDWIPTVIFKSISHAHQQDTECVVCLTQFEQEAEVSHLPCGHFFHKTCFDRWLGYWHNTCPLCRSPAMPEEEGWL